MGAKLARFAHTVAWALCGRTHPSVSAPFATGPATNPTLKPCQITVRTPAGCWGVAKR